MVLIYTWIYVGKRLFIPVNVCGSEAKSFLLFRKPNFTKYHGGRSLDIKREITPFSYNSKISYSLQTGNKFNRSGTIWLEAAVTEKRNIDFWSFLIFSFFILLVIVIRLYMLTFVLN